MEDAFERLEAEKEQRDLKQKDATCQYCGRTRLRWKKHKGQWRLFEKGKPHRCPESGRWK